MDKGPLDESRAGGGGEGAPRGRLIARSVDAADRNIMLVAHAVAEFVQAAFGLREPAFQFAASLLPVVGFAIVGAVLATGSIQDTVLLILAAACVAASYGMFDRVSSGYLGDLGKPWNGERKIRYAALAAGRRAAMPPSIRLLAFALACGVAAVAAGGWDDTGTIPLVAFVAFATVATMYVGCKSPHTPIIFASRN